MIMKRKQVATVVVFLFALFVFIQTAVASGNVLADVAPDDELPFLTAHSAIVIEASTGRVLYERAADAQKYPASTTKIMTLIVALEQGNLDDIVTVSHNASGTEGSTIWLEPDEHIRLLDLLYGMMLVSGNDATVAVAEHIAGGVNGFARMMTSKAHGIGAWNTSFVNSSGLPDAAHYTTARDLALITAYGYKNPMFGNIVATKEKQIPWADNDYNRELRNENRMLWLYDGGNGVKTGYTDAAGRCLVAAACRDGVQIISVVLDSSYIWNDSIALLDYGFSHIVSHEFRHKGDNVAQVKVLSGKQDTLNLVTATDLSVPIVPGEESHFSTQIEVPDKISAPIAKNEIIGKMTVSYDGKEVASADLLAVEKIEKKSFFLLIYKGAADLCSGLFNI